MGTYSDSKIVTARVAHTCGRCERTIHAGERYLRYKLGLRNDIKRCSDCMVLTLAEADWPISGDCGDRLAYDCAAIRKELGLEPDRTRVG